MLEVYLFLASTKLVTLTGLLLMFQIALGVYYIIKALGMQGDTTKLQKLLESYKCWVIVNVVGYIIYATFLFYQDIKI